MYNKQRIVEEAAFMFRTYGIRTVTMDMLAGHLGISKRTLYEVFRDKDELLQGVIKLMTLKQEAVMGRIFNESENVIEAIFKMLDLMTEHFRNMSPAFLMDMRRHHFEMMKKMGALDDLPYANNNAGILKRGIKEGIFRKDINIEIANKCMSEVARMSNDKEVFPPESFMNKEVLRDFYLNYLRGISTRKGLDLINFHEKKQTQNKIK